MLSKMFSGGIIRKPVLLPSLQYRFASCLETTSTRHLPLYKVCSCYSQVLQSDVLLIPGVHGRIRLYSMLFINRCKRLGQCNYCKTTIRGESRGGDCPPPKTYESSFVHHYFVQFEKQHLRIRSFCGWSIVLSQLCCEAHFISLTVVDP